MMTSADKVGGWVKKGQNHDDVILEWSPTKLACQRCKQMIPTLDDFRLGIQKCRKTIQATVQDDRIFHLQGIESMFTSLRQAADQMDRAKNCTTVKNSQ